MIDLKTLGGLAILVDGKALQGAPAQRRRLALLALLAGAGERGMSRDKLLAFLWPESDAERARHALAQLLHILQRDLGEDACVTGTTELRLNSAVLRSDLEEFREALRRDDRERAIELYAGPFLDGFHLDGAPEFERWIDEVRAPLAAEFAGALEAQAVIAGRRNEHGQAARYWRRLAALDPLNGRIAVGLMVALRDAGDRAGALRHARVHEELVRQELGGIADPAVAALAESIRAEPVVTAIPAPPPSRESPPPIETDRAGSHSASVLSPPKARGVRWMVLAALLVVTLGAGFLINSKRVDPLDSRRVLVGVFENRTGDSAMGMLGDITADYVARGLAETRLAHGVIDARVEAADSAERNGVRGSRALAIRTGAGTLIWGNYYRRGDSLRFEGEVIDSRSGRLLQSLEPAMGPAGDETRVVELVRQRVMTAFAVLFDPAYTDWQAQIRPPTYDAYREILAGDDATWRYDYSAALTHFRRAAELDSSYIGATTHAILVYALSAECGTVDSVAVSLSAIQHQLPPVDRGRLEWARATCRGDWRAALEAGRLVLDAIPRSVAFGALVGVTALELGRPREALTVLERSAPEPSAGRGVPLANFLSWMALAYHELGDHRSELRTARRSLALLPRTRHTNALLEEATALAALGRVAEVERRLDQWPSTPPGEVPSTGEMLLIVALELRAHGQPQAGQSVLERVSEWYRSRPAEESSQGGKFIALRDLFSVQYYLGRWDEARAAYQRLALSDSSSVMARAALGALAARRGDRPEAEQMDRWLAGRAVTGGAVPLARARIAALLGQRERAVTQLRQAFENGRRLWVHFDPDFESLRGFAPFDELLRPIG
jgi:DNA-binding SARP family transcriptional activator